MICAATVENTGGADPLVRGRRPRRPAELYRVLEVRVQGDPRGLE